MSRRAVPPLDVMHASVTPATMAFAEFLAIMDVDVVTDRDDHPRGAHAVTAHSIVRRSLDASLACGDRVLPFRTCRILYPRRKGSRDGRIVHALERATAEAGRAIRVRRHGARLDLRFSDLVASVHADDEGSELMVRVVLGDPGERVWTRLPDGAFEDSSEGPHVEAVGGLEGLAFLDRGLAALGWLSTDDGNPILMACVKLQGHAPSEAMLLRPGESSAADAANREAQIVADAVLDCVAPRIAEGFPKERTTRNVELRDTPSSTLAAVRRISRASRLSRLAGELDARGGDPQAVAILERIAAEARRGRDSGAPASMAAAS